jgi:glycosyltransferase involved in cell wall biosynthesis
MTPRLSVVLPVRNGGPLLLRQVLALLHQESPPSYEVIVVDNLSTDGSPEAARRLVEEFEPGSSRFVYVKASMRPSLGYARNVGAASSTAPAIAFCDQDDVVGPGWVQAHERAASLHSIWVGRIESRVLNARATAAVAQGSYAAFPVLGYRPSVAGSNFGMRLDLFHEAGGFDEAIPSCEDIEMSWRVQRLGHKIGYAGDAVVLRQFRDTHISVYNQGVWYGRGQAWLFARYRTSGMPRGGSADAWHRIRRNGLGVLRPGHSESRLDSVHCLGLILGRLAEVPRTRVWY